MRTKEITNRQALKIAFVLLALAGWVSIPLLNNNAEAGDTPILIRNATLVSPTGSVNPYGAAEYQLYANNNRELEVEIEDVNLPVGTSLTAFVDGTSVGEIVLDIRQGGRLKLRTQDGQTVPVVNEGSTVQVKNGSTVLVAGVFDRGGPAPTPTGSPIPSPTRSPSGTPGSTPSPTPTPSGTPNSANLFARLAGPTLNGVLPGGYAEFEVEGSNLELEVKVRQVNLPVGTTLNVLVNNTQAGNLVLVRAGEGELRLRTENGDTVPAIVVGSTISVKNGETTILSGVFTRVVGPAPTPTGTPGPTPTPRPMGRSFEAHLTGSRVQPPVQTDANGEFKVILNPDETQATIYGEFQNLGSNQTGARVETTTGSPVLIRDFGAIGGRSGEFASVTLPVSAALVQQLRTGLWSAVITSVNNPSGEISGRFTLQSDVSDFDGDGNNDFALFRPSNGVWYSQNDSGFSAQVLGNADDKVVSGDYDGDGRTDAAVFKNVGGQGVWEVRRSSDGGTDSEQFGFSSDIPARGDFDGDGRADLAVYRPSTGVWYVKNSDNSGYAIVRFGLAEDQPVPSDMDGDGRDDIVVFRPSTGVWYWLRSSDGQFGAAQFGLNGDVPIRGDFDGDGKQDLTVFRPSTGVWYVFRSSDASYQIGRFGLDGDIPVAGNYDSDGKTDIAVFRPSDGYWYILNSSDGSFRTFRFGLSGDIPLIAR